MSVRRDWMFQVLYQNFIFICHASHNNVVRELPGISLLTIHCHIPVSFGSKQRHISILQELLHTMICEFPKKNLCASTVLKTFIKTAGEQQNQGLQAWITKANQTWTGNTR
jgi:hypothetical protein